MAQQRLTRVILGLIVLGVVVGVIVAVYVYLTGGSGQASGPIQAPELTAETVSGTVFQIVPEESQVRFIIDEVLRGNPNTVIGRTNQIAGELLIDFDNPANSQVGTIRVNARTLMTDDEFRNRAIRGQILQSAQDEFEFSQFTPTALEGLPESITFGEPITVQITGDLTVRDVTNPVTFDATVTPVSDTRLEGTAAAMIRRADYNLTIPNVPGVADVADEVGLEIDFVAVAAELNAEVTEGQ